MHAGGGAAGRAHHRVGSSTPHSVLSYIKLVFLLRENEMLNNLVEVITDELMYLSLSDFRTCAQCKLTIFRHGRAAYENADG